MVYFVCVLIDCLLFAFDGYLVLVIVLSVGRMLFGLIGLLFGFVCIC